jgi:hypothetical protein
MSLCNKLINSKAEHYGQIRKNQGEIIKITETSDKVWVTKKGEDPSGIGSAKTRIRVNF